MAGTFKDISLKYNLFTIKNNIVMSILGSAVEFTAFGYCLFRLWTHDITYGTMTLFLQQRSNLSGAFGNVISIIPSFLNSSVSAHRIRELVELPKEVHIPESAKLDPLAKDGFRVQMHGVEFSYIEGNKVITRSEFQAAPGEIVALVGPSGEGKTTMIRLILGLIRPQEGETVIIASNGKTVPMNAETRHLFFQIPQHFAAVFQRRLCGGVLPFQGRILLFEQFIQLFLLSQQGCVPIRQLWHIPTIGKA